MYLAGFKCPQRQTSASPGRSVICMVVSILHARLPWIGSSLTNIAAACRAESCWQKLAEEVRRQVVDRFLSIELVPGVCQKIADLAGDEPASLEQVWPGGPS